MSLFLLTCTFATWASAFGNDIYGDEVERLPMTARIDMNGALAAVSLPSDSEFGPYPATFLEGGFSGVWALVSLRLGGPVLMTVEPRSGTAFLSLHSYSLVVDALRAEGRCDILEEPI
ncbi:MAG: hypothetical protein AAF646_09955 [Pseudomonadota bacterium]